MAAKKVLKSIKGLVTLFICLKQAFPPFMILKTIYIVLVVVSKEKIS